MSQMDTNGHCYIHGLEAHFSRPVAGTVATYWRQSLRVFRQHKAYIPYMHNEWRPTNPKTIRISKHVRKKFPGIAHKLLHAGSEQTCSHVSVKLLPTENMFLSRSFLKSTCASNIIQPPFIFGIPKQSEAIGSKCPNDVPPFVSCPPSQLLNFRHTQHQRRLLHSRRLAFSSEGERQLQMVQLLENGTKITNWMGTKTRQNPYRISGCCVRIYWIYN